MRLPIQVRSISRSGIGRRSSGGPAAAGYAGGVSPSREVCACPGCAQPETECNNNGGCGCSSGKCVCNSPE